MSEFKITYPSGLSIEPQGEFDICEASAQGQPIKSGVALYITSHIIEISSPRGSNETDMNMGCVMGSFDSHNPFATKKDVWMESGKDSS